MVAPLGHVHVETRVRVLQHHLVPPLLRRGRPVHFWLLRLLRLKDQHETQTKRTTWRCRHERRNSALQPLAACGRCQSRNPEVSVRSNSSGAAGPHQYARIDGIGASFSVAIFVAACEQASALNIKRYLSAEWPTENHTARDVLYPCWLRNYCVQRTEKVQRKCVVKMQVRVQNNFALRP